MSAHGTAARPPSRHCEVVTIAIPEMLFEDLIEVERSIKNRRSYGGHTASGPWVRCGGGQGEVCLGWSLQRRRNTGLKSFCWRRVSVQSSPFVPSASYYRHQSGLLNHP